MVHARISPAAASALLLALGVSVLCTPLSRAAFPPALLRDLGTSFGTPAPKQNRDTLRVAAGKGDAGAAYQLGLMLESDAATRAEAIEWYGKSAAAGSNDAKGRLGWCTFSGIGIAANANEGVRLVQEAANAGSANAQVLLALICFTRGEAKTGIQWAQAADAQGDAGGSALLGAACEFGEGLPPDADKAMRWYGKAAAKGNAVAQSYLGAMLVTGADQVMRQPQQGITWLQKAAAAGYTRAQVQLGYCLAQGLGAGKDDAKAVQWYRQAAAQGDPAADAYLAHHLRLGRGCEKNVPEAVRLFEKVTASPDAAAIPGLLLFAQLCLEGDEGFPRDSKRALALLERAGDLGSIGADAVAQQLALKDVAFDSYRPQWIKSFTGASNATAPTDETKLGLTDHLAAAGARTNRRIASEGIGQRTPTPEEVLATYSKITNSVPATAELMASAKSGDSRAGVQVALALFSGKGVAQDIPAAIQALEKAANDGNAIGQLILGARLATGEQMDRNPQLATDWMEKAAKQGNHDAEYLAAWACLGKFGTPPRQEEAVVWLQKCAERGNAYALFELGQCQLFGRGTERSIEQARVSFLRSAEAGCREAMCQMGFMGLRDHDTENALRWLRKAAELGLPDAQFALGTAYSDGTIVRPDPVLAYRWLSLAANGGHPTAGKVLQLIRRHMTPEQIAAAQQPAPPASKP